MRALLVFVTVIASCSRQESPRTIVRADDDLRYSIKAAAVASGDYCHRDEAQTCWRLDVEHRSMFLIAQERRWTAPLTLRGDGESAELRAVGEDDGVQYAVRLIGPHSVEIHKRDAVERAPELWDLRASPVRLREGPLVYSPGA